MRAGQTLSQLTGNLLFKLEEHFKSSPADLILAHGDTTTCFATAISSFYHKIPFFHVEAGLRTYRLNSPFPEEFNRQTIAPIAAHHFAPTDLEKNNLVKDGISTSRITISGTTVHDAVMSMKNRTKNNLISEVDFQNRPIVTVTLHRREADQLIYQTLDGIKTAAQEKFDILFFCPVHPNPKIKEAFQTLKGLKNVFLTEPMDYPNFISLLMKSTLVVTDSGGVQEEAAFLGKSVLIARAETERTDGMESGLVKLVGNSAKQVHQSIIEEISNKKTHGFYSSRPSPSASKIISDYVEKVIG